MRCSISLPKSFCSAASGGATVACSSSGRTRRVWAAKTVASIHACTTRPRRRSELAGVDAPDAAQAVVHRRDRARALLEADLELGRPERAALVAERGLDHRPAAVDRAEHVVGRDAAVLEEELAELALAGELAGRHDGEAGRRQRQQQAARGPCASAPARRCAPAAGTTCARWARLDHTFWPVITHSSPSRSALVRSEARSEPALGSEKPSDHISSADRMPGRKRRCCAARADADQRRADDAEADVVEDARRVDPRQLLGVDHLLARAGAAPAVLARPLRRQPAAVVAAGAARRGRTRSARAPRAARRADRRASPSGRLCSSQARSSRETRRRCGVSASVIMREG